MFLRLSISETSTLPTSRSFADLISCIGTWPFRLSSPSFYYHGLLLSLGWSGLHTCFPPGTAAQLQVNFTTGAFQIVNSHSCCCLPTLQLSAPTENFLLRNGGGGGGGFIFGLSWLRCYGSSGVLLYRGKVIFNVLMLIQTSVSKFFKSPYKALKCKPEFAAFVHSPRSEGTLHSAYFCRIEASLLFFLNKFVSFGSLLSPSEVIRLGDNALTYWTVWTQISSKVLTLLVSQENRALGGWCWGHWERTLAKFVRIVQR